MFITETHVFLLHFYLTTYCNLVQVFAEEVKGGNEIVQLTFRATNLDKKVKKACYLQTKSFTLSILIFKGYSKILAVKWKGGVQEGHKWQHFPINWCSMKQFL